MLRKGLEADDESGGSTSEDAIKPAAEHATQRLEHYELVQDQDGNLSSWGAVPWV
jgi:hypothetical protein